MRSLMIAVLLSTASLSGSFVAGCAAQASENFYALRDGMSKEAVRELLGAPSSTWPGDEGTERWQYGDSLSSLATSGVFRDADTARVWAVWFDVDGKVTAFAEPDWKRQ
ncbi:MAG: outer membrane protein assembly factor BamE [Phycisphaerae bacterium]|nr:outer membrane protein assembly factor BamE [Phycisphaerae bacterium]